MKKVSLLLSLAGLLMLGACQHEKTRYTVEYLFDNTEMGTQLLEVYECDAEGRANGKWLADHHTYDTVNTAEGQRIMVSGCVKGVASEGCAKLWVSAGTFTNGTLYQLDTMFRLELLKDNHFLVGDGMKWLKDSLYN